MTVDVNYSLLLFCLLKLSRDEIKWLFCEINIIIQFLFVHIL